MSPRFPGESRRTERVARYRYVTLLSRKPGQQCAFWFRPSHHRIQGKNREGVKKDGASSSVLRCNCSHCGCRVLCPGPRSCCLVGSAWHWPAGPEPEATQPVSQDAGWERIDPGLPAGKNWIAPIERLVPPAGPKRQTRCLAVDSDRTCVSIEVQVRDDALPPFRFQVLVLDPNLRYNQR